MSNLSTWIKMLHVMLSHVHACLLDISASFGFNHGLSVKTLYRK